MESRSRQYGDGALFRFSNTVYWFLATEFYLVVTSLPVVFALVFLERDPSNAVLYAIAGAFLGPAIAAALHCMRKIMREKDLNPTRDFVRGYRLNVLDTLKFWVPAVAVIAILVLNLRSLETQNSPMDAVLQVLMVLVALVGTLWLMNMMVISTAFHFRQRDLARLSVFYLGKTLRITFGNLATLFIAAVLLLLTSDWVLLLCSSLFVYLFALNTADLVAQVEARFTGASPTQNRSE
jgi:uncharacterized membrane protein YesL